MQTEPPYQARSWWWVPGLQAHQGKWSLKVRVRSRGVPHSTTRSLQWNCDSACGPGLRCSFQRHGTDQKEIIFFDLLLHNYIITPHWTTRLNDRMTGVIGQTLSGPESDEYIQIFEYFWSEYLFGYSFVSFFGYEYIRIFVRVNFLDTNIFGYSFVSRFWFEYIRIFVCINFQDTNRFKRCFCWFSLHIILCLWIFCWYQW